MNAVRSRHLELLGDRFRFHENFFRSHPFHFQAKNPVKF